MENKKTTFTSPETEKKKPEKRFFGKNQSKEQRGKEFKSPIESEKIEMRRVTNMTKGGRRFSFGSSVLIKNEEKKSLAAAYCKGKEPVTAFKKSLLKAQKNLISYYLEVPRTIPYDLVVKFKATKIVLKPAPEGTGIKAGGVLNKFFKFLGIKDVSAKIIGSKKNKMNVIKAAFLAMEKFTGKKYDY